MDNNANNNMHDFIISSIDKTIRQLESEQLSNNTILIFGTNANERQNAMISELKKVKNVRLVLVAQQTMIDSLSNTDVFDEIMIFGKKYDCSVVDYLNTRLELERIDAMLFYSVIARDIRNRNMIELGKYAKKFEWKICCYDALERIYEYMNTDLYLACIDAYMNINKIYEYV